MKYESKRKSGAGPMIYQFSIGKEEMVCMKQLMDDAERRTPRTVDTMPFRGRIKTITKELARVITQEGIKIPRSYSHEL